MPFPNLHDLLDNNSLSYHLENTSFGVMLWDKQSTMIYCSPKAAAIFEGKPIDLLQKTFDFNLLTHENTQSISSLIAALASSQTNHNEGLTENMTKKGNIIYCQWYNSILKDDHGQVIHILSLCKDVTSKVATELSFQKREHQLSLAF